MKEPAASVVIPTRGRPSLVRRAVTSALAQTAPSLEVIVVLDGPDGATDAAVEQVGDERVRVVALPRRAGPGAARNAGVAAARGEVVAFLDDDDEWRPEKLAAQLAALASAGGRRIVSCRVIARDDRRRDRVWPRRLPEADEPLSEYLLARHGLRWGESLVQTSTIAVHRALAEQVPFREDLRRHEDLDWLLRAARTGASLVFAPAEEPLVVWHVDERRTRASRQHDPADSLDWIRSVRALVTPRAYAAFLLGWIPADASGSERIRLLPRLLAESFRDGRPAPVDLLIAAGVTLVPARARSVTPSRPRARLPRRRARPRASAS
jgi:GT2 family glycosyltransferase